MAGLKHMLETSTEVSTAFDNNYPTIIRIYAESDNQKGLDDLMHEYTEKIKSIIAR